MGQVEQVFWTHCTTSTSFSGGEGYTVRATSIARSAWDNSLTAVLDPLLMANKYEPPVDSPAHARHSNAHRMPVRFSYYPSARDWSVLIHDCYRAEDSTQYRRLGCQFAHCLATRRRPSWSTADCLRLWRAPFWVRVDPSNSDPTLPSSESLTELMQGVTPAVSEEVLYRFLTTAADGDFQDRQSVIPAYCRRATAETRLGILHDLFEGFLGLDRKNQAWLLLVADPDLAALLFFGVLRLLPPSVLEAPVSFSTYESSLTTRGLTMVATTFYDPLKHQLDPMIPKAPGCSFILDLFRARRSVLPEPGPKYPGFTLRLLRDQGWDAVDQWLRRCESAGARSASDLEELVREHAVARRLFSPGSEVPALPADSRLQRYAKLLVQDRLARPVTTPSGASTFGDPAALAAAPGCITALHMLFTDGEAVSVRAGASRLLRHLTAQKLEAIIADVAFPDEFRLEALQAHLNQKKRIPATWLLQMAAASDAPEQVRHRQLLGRLIQSEPLDGLKRILRSTSGEARSLVLREMAAVSSASRPCRDLLWRLLITDPTLTLEFLNVHGLYDPMVQIVESVLGAKVLTKDQIRQLAIGENMRTVAALMLSLKSKSLVKLACDVLRESAGSDVFAIVRMPVLPYLSRANVLLSCLKRADPSIRNGLSQLFEDFHAACVSPDDPRKLRMVAIAVVMGLDAAHICQLSVDVRAQDSSRHRILWLDMVLCAIEYHRSKNLAAPEQLVVAIGDLLKTFNIDSQLRLVTEHYRERIVEYLPQVQRDDSPAESQTLSESTNRAPLPREWLVNRLIRWQVKLLITGHVEQEWASATSRLAVLMNAPHVTDSGKESAQRWSDFLAKLDEFGLAGAQAKRPRTEPIIELTRAYCNAVPDDVDHHARRDLALRFLNAAQTPDRLRDGFVHVLAVRGRLESVIRHMDVMPDPVAPSYSLDPKSSKSRKTKQLRFYFPHYISPTLRITVLVRGKRKKSNAPSDWTQKHVELERPGSKKHVTIVTLADVGIDADKLSAHDLEIAFRFASEFWGERFYESNYRQLREADFINYGPSSSFYMRMVDGSGVDQSERYFLKGLLRRWDDASSEHPNSILLPE